MSRPKKTTTNTTKNTINETTPINNEYYIPRNYARSQVQPMWASTTTNISTEYTVDKIQGFLRNPYKSYKNLQQAGEYISNINSVYNNYLDYFAGIMSFDYVLYPFGITENKSTMWNRLYESAKIVSKIQPKNIFPWMLKIALHQGEAYFYDLSDNENTIIVEIPKEVCVLSHIDDDNLWRYFVDVALINSATIEEYPEEIQNAYQDYIDNKKPKGKRTEGELKGIPYSYYQVSKRGFSIFAHMEKKPHDYPYFSHMFCDLTFLSNDKAYFNEFIKDDAIKTIHQRVPIDKDSGVPLMPKEVIEAYHNSSKEHVGKNISIMTNPFEVEGIALDKNQQSALNVVEHDINIIQSDSGISKTIFNAETVNGLTFSTETDAARMYPLLYFFNNFINYKIKQKKCQVEFLHTNIFNRDDRHEEYRTDLLSGGSRSLFISTSGIDLYGYLNLLDAEKLLDFDEKLVPKLNASQANNDDLNGRPPKDEKDKEDSTVSVDGYK
ncbi:MAG: hypothetical protein GX639_02945 [Fibrobacter sp.]|nr:hypothetical protein [Fibrobacter sp.]